MERLKGKTILVGRESSENRLLVAIKGSGKTALVGSKGSVPSSVSRYRPSDGTAHCKIDVDQVGGLVITNLKLQNATYVNDMEIKSKHIDTSDVVALGSDRYALDVNMVLHTAIKLVENSASAEAPTLPKTYSIKPLESVWKEYKERCRAVRKRWRRITLIRVGCSIFTMCAMPCIFLFGPIGYVLTGIGIIGSIYSFVGLKNNDPSEELEKIDDWLDDNYICPNPDCCHSMGKSKYKYLLQNGKCPYCRCNFTE